MVRFEGLEEGDMVVSINGSEVVSLRLLNSTMRHIAKGGKPECPLRHSSSARPLPQQRLRVRQWTFRFEYRVGYCEWCGSSVSNSNSCSSHLT